MTRPEAGGGGGLPDEWANYGDRAHGTWYEFDADRNVQRHTRDERNLGAPYDPTTTRSDDVPSYQPNDKVRAKNDVKGIFGTKVPTGTNGRVVSTRGGLFTSYVTVEFDNGYTEEVKTSDVTKRGWFD